MEDRSVEPVKMPISFKKPAIYLKKLILKNFAIFTEQEIHFKNSFNAIIGETGSGKSLILEALLIVLGGRSDKKYIRPENNSCHIEAIFHVEDKSIESFFCNLGYPIEDREIIIKRVIYKDRPSKTYLNFSQCSLFEIEKFTQSFIDFVGQFDNQKILQNSYQLSLIDHYANNLDLLKKYQNAFQKYQQQIKYVESLTKESKEKDEKLHFIKYQLEELNKLNPSKEDEENLIIQKNNFKKIEKVKEFSHKIMGPLSENEDFNIINLFKKILRTIDNNSNLIGEPLRKKAVEIFDQLNDFSYQISREISHDDLEININEVMAKIFLYQKLKGQYGASSEELQMKQQQLKIEIEGLEKIDISLVSQNQILKNLYHEVIILGEELHQNRIKFSKILEKNLTEKIRSLNMSESTLRIHLETIQKPCESGISQLLLEVETNKNYGYHQLREIASGGELSRILLAIRHELATKDTIQIFLFDEIDTGLGGTTALKIGKTLSEVAKNSQVIAITHLPQIAHCADKLIIVSKTSAQNSHDDKSIAIVSEVAGKEKLKQVRAMTPLN